MVGPRRFTVAPLIVVVSLALVLAGPVGRASADEDYIRGDVSGTINFGPDDNFGVGSFLAGKAGWWVSCDVAGYWSTVPSTDRDYLRLTGGCRRGWSMNDGDLEVWTEVENCGTLTARPGNIDAPSETANFTVLMVPSGGDGSSGQDCGMAGNLCASVDGEGSVCKAWNVGEPPAEQDSYYSSQVGGCDYFDPYVPWVGPFEAVTVPGGWAWRSTVVQQIDPLGNAWPKDLGVAGTTDDLLWPLMLTSISAPAAPYLVERKQLATDPWTTAGTTYGAQRWAGTQFNATSYAAHRITGPVLTGAVGSQPVNWSWTGAGVTWDRNGVVPNASVSSRPTTWPSRPTMAGIYNSIGPVYGGHHDPGLCSFWWGTEVIGDSSGYSAPLAPLSGQATADLPPLVEVSVTPPTIVIDTGSGCDPDADACIQPAPVPDDDPPPSVPDPESSSCDFSITEPSTWGGQLVCALVWVAQAIVDAIAAVVEGLAGIVTALLEGLASLFVPDADLLSDRIAGIRDAFEGGPVGEWTSATSGAFESSGSSGGCQGMEIDVSVVGVPGVEPMRPFAACDGASASAAATVRLVATVLLGLGGGLVIVRMLTSSLGIRVPTPGERQ